MNIVIWIAIGSSILRYFLVKYIKDKKKSYDNPEALSELQ